MGRLTPLLADMRCELMFEVHFVNSSGTLHPRDVVDVAVDPTGGVKVFRVPGSVVVVQRELVFCTCALSVSRVIVQLMSHSP